MRCCHLQSELYSLETRSCVFASSFKMLVAVEYVFVLKRYDIMSAMLFSAKKFCFIQSYCLLARFKLVELEATNSVISSLCACGCVSLWTVAALLKPFVTQYRLSYSLLPPTPSSSPPPVLKSKSLEQRQHKKLANQLND